MSKFTLFHTCCNWYKLSADDAAVVKRRPSSLSPPPTGGWVMGMWDELGRACLDAGSHCSATD